jgi:copper chaperone NosL
MNNKLSVVSRILVAFASGALVAVFFLPAWRIDLFAPQYPEGLTMNIWINNITGDVDVINGLNHYIGMKHITVDMFPEFSYLPYVVGFFMLLGIIVSITGSGKLLFVYVALTVVGGALAMYDFYQWGYDYGHNLDPKAPIQVAGLSYQPPLIGHKRLLNFDAYSFPDVGGWIVIAAGFLAAGVWATEWYLNRRKIKTTIPKLAIFSIIVLFLVSCNTSPEPFQPGKDNCYACKMAISDTRFGAELITKKGKIYKFDDLHCLAGFLGSKAAEEKDIAQTLTINFDKPNSFLDVEKAVYLIGEGVKSPMGSNAAGFASKEDALRVGETMKGETVDWATLRNRLN